MNNASPTTTGLPARVVSRRLRSPLARLSLRQEGRDPHRLLAWVNSICAVVLVLGFTELLISRPTPMESPPTRVSLPVLLTELADQPVSEPTRLAATSPWSAAERAAAVPPPVTVVPVIKPMLIAAPMAVDAVAAIVPATELAEAADGPPQSAGAAAVHHLRSDRTATGTYFGPARFDPAAQSAGYFPSPRYPALAVRHRWRGKTVLLIEVASSGRVTRVEVSESSGHVLLDDAALQAVRTRWRFPAGELRIYLWDCTFRIQ